MSVHHNSPIQGLRNAVPYLRLFKGRVFVIKAGGEVFDHPEHTLDLLEQVGVLHQLGLQVVVVHGGGGQTSRLAERLGIETRFVRGRRVTDEPTRDITTMTLNGAVHTGILAVCLKLGIKAVGLCGIDSGLIRAVRRPPVQVEGEGLVDYGFVGDIKGVNPRVVQDLLAGGHVPIISPISADDEGCVLNLNADGVAAALAVALKAEKLIFLTAAPGILSDPDDVSSLVAYADLAAIAELKANGSLRGGMLPKIAAMESALQGGVRRVHMVGYRTPDSLLVELFTNQGCGTLVEVESQPLEPLDDQSGVVPWA